MTDEPRLGPPPIEPLSDAAWARVERGVWSQLGTERPVAGRGPGPRRWWLIAAPLAAAAAVVAVVIAVRGGPVAPDEPSRVVTGEASSSVQFGDSHIELDATTALVMSHEAEHPIVTLERGAAWFTVAPRLERPAFLVRAGDARVRVVGTRFRVARSEERIAVAVDHGRVEVNFRGGEVAVSDGQRWSSDAPAQVVTAGPPPAAPPPAPVAAPASEAPVVPAPPPAPAPAPARPHRPAHPASSAPPAAPTSSAAPAAPGPAIDRDAAEYNRLAVLEASSPGQALPGYLALAQGTSRWAELALFAAARLAVDRHDARAAGMLGDYLRRFPRGANAADARQLLSRLHDPP